MVEVSPLRIVACIGNSADLDCTRIEKEDYDKDHCAVVIGTHSGPNDIWSNVCFTGDASDITTAPFAFGCWATAAQLLGDSGFT